MNFVADWSLPPRTASITRGRPPGTSGWLAPRLVEVAGEQASCAPFRFESGRVEPVRVPGFDGFCRRPEALQPIGRVPKAGALDGGVSIAGRTQISGRSFNTGTMASARPPAAPCCRNQRSRKMSSGMINAARA